MALPAASRRARGNQRLRREHARCALDVAQQQIPLETRHVFVQLVVLERDDAEEVRRSEGESSSQSGDLDGDQGGGASSIASISHIESVVCYILNRHSVYLISTRLQCTRLISIRLTTLFSLRLDTAVQGIAAEHRGEPLQRRRSLATFLLFVLVRHCLVLVRHVQSLLARQPEQP